MLIGQEIVHIKLSLNARHLALHSQVVTKLLLLIKCLPILPLHFLLAGILFLNLLDIHVDLSLLDDGWVDFLSRLVVRLLLLEVPLHLLVQLGRMLLDLLTVRHHLLVLLHASSGVLLLAVSIDPECLPHDSLLGWGVHLLQVAFAGCLLELVNLPLSLLKDLNLRVPLLEVVIANHSPLVVLLVSHPRFHSLLLANDLGGLKELTLLSPQLKPLGFFLLALLLGSNNRLQDLLLI